ncbi:MAG: hypothetical protein ACEY3J_03025 [Arsenophonus sp.]
MKIHLRRQLKVNDVYFSMHICRHGITPFISHYLVFYQKMS